jgi:hypothetical protein
MSERARVVTRLEPTGPAPLAEVLAARLGDPLWLLARQWQMGELLGEDAGTAVSAELHLTVSPLTHLAAGRPPAGWPTRVDTDRLDASRPLDATVRAAPLARQPLWRRADGGRLAVTLATEAGLENLGAAALNAYPLQPPAADDDEGLALWTVWREALPDGELLHAALVSVDLTDPAAVLPMALADAGPSDAVRDILQAWMEHWTAIAPLAEQLTAWDPETLTHRFALAAATSESTTRVRWRRSRRRARLALLHPDAHRARARGRAGARAPDDPPHPEPAALPGDARRALVAARRPGRRPGRH